MHEVKVNIPDDLYNEVTKINDQMLIEIFQKGFQQVKITQALEKYKNGNITFGRAAELAGLGEDDFAQEAYANGIYPDYSEETLLEELK